MRFQYLNPLENFWALTLSRVHREEKPFLTFLCKIDILEKRELRNIAPPTHKYTHPHLKKTSFPPPLPYISEFPYFFKNISPTTRFYMILIMKKDLDGEKLTFTFKMWSIIHIWTNFALKIHLNGQKPRFNFGKIEFKRCLASKF